RLVLVALAARPGSRWNWRAGPWTRRTWRRPTTRRTRTAPGPRSPLWRSRKGSSPKPPRPYSSSSSASSSEVGTIYLSCPSSPPVYTYLARIDPKLLLHMFLPILIFESAFAMDAHTFVRCFSQCILMAVPGLRECI
ncbi:unnamed protein product, partial [Ixodes pacificus]